MKYEISEFTLFSGRRVCRMEEFRGDDESFTVPEGVTDIWSFQECPNLRRVTLPASVNYISPHAFKNCPRMEELIIARENDEFKASDGVLYLRKEAIAEDWYAYGRKDVDLKIAEWATKINPFAFKDCTSIRSVSFPETLTEIGKSAFENCVNLKNIEFSDSLRVIGETAFYRCPKINCIDLPKGLEKLCERAFARCEGIEAVIIPDSVRKLEFGVFVNCSFVSIEHLGVCYELKSPSDYLEIEKKIQSKIKEVHPPRLRKIWVKDYPYMDEFEYLSRDSDEEAYGWREKWVDEDYKLKPDERESL